MRICEGRGAHDGSSVHRLPAGDGEVAGGGVPTVGGGGAAPVGGGKHWGVTSEHATGHDATSSAICAAELIGG